MVKPRKRRNESNEDFTKRAIKEYYADGYHMIEIANKLKCDIRQVYNVLVSNKYKITTSEEREIMILMRNNGDSYAKIAKTLGRSRACIKARIEKAAGFHIESNTYTLTNRELDNIRKWYTDGKTMHWIATQLKISDRAVRYRLEKMGIYTRDLSLHIPLTKTEKITIKAMILTNKSISEIATSIGRHYRTVNEYLNGSDNENK